MQIELINNDSMFPVSMIFIFFIAFINKNEKKFNQVFKSNSFENS
jgi:hypothetical protein